MSNEYIHEENGNFIIRRDIKGNLVEFGSFSTLNEAIEYKEELEEDGWPYRKEQIITSKNNQEKSTYGEYITKEEGKYIVSKEFNGKRKVFGKFIKLEDAKEFKYKLIEHGWDDSFKSLPGKYGKFITKNGDKFYVNKSIQGKKTSFGPYNSLDEAVLARNKLIDSNWGVEGEVNLYKEGKYGKYISKQGDIYRITKSFDKEILIFGEYDTLEDAIKARDILAESDWDEDKVPEYLYSWRHFVSYNPRMDGFEIYNLIDGHFISFGFFDDHVDVKIALEILRSNNWDATEIPFYLYSEYSNIRYYNRGKGETFSVVRRVDGEIIQYESFDNYDDAIARRNELILSNWDDTIDSEEKYDEFIYLRSDGKYYLKNKVNGVMCIFGVYEDYIEAVNARLKFIKKQWDVESVPEDEYF